MALLPAARAAAAAARARKAPRDSFGRFISKAQQARNEGVESYLRAQLGAPPAGKSWQAIAARYSERFSDFLQDMDE